MEEKNKEYRLNFSVWKESFSPWAERDAQHLMNVVSVTRLNNNLKFAGYGTVKFDEDDLETHYHPIVVEQDKFNKKTTDIVIFDVVNNKLPFDKLFVYHSNAGSKGAAGYYMWSSTNPDLAVHKYYLDNMVSAILLALSKTFSELYSKYCNHE